MKRPEAIQINSYEIDIMLDTLKKVGDTQDRIREQIRKSGRWEEYKKALKEAGIKHEPQIFQT